MTIETPPVGLTGHHTEATLVARHREALDIFEAWCDRVRNSGGQDRVAAELQRDEAWDWVVATKADLDLYRSVACRRGAVAGRSVPHGRSGVIPYPRHFQARRNESRA
ncbi:MAG TPA: hypothetical protein VIQ52_09435 [Arthrobacter sp.]